MDFGARTEGRPVRRITLLVAVALAITVTATCPAAEPVSIEIGNLATMDLAKEWLDHEIAAFMKAHPNVQVKVLPYSDPDRDLNPVHTNPFLPKNIIGLDSRAGCEAAYLAEKGDLVPVDHFLPDPDFDKNQFYDNYWDAVTYGGKVWGVPWQVWSDLLVCDMEIFKAAGIAEPPKTIHELIDMVPKLTNLEGKIEQYGLRVSMRIDPLLDWLMTLTLQQGGRIVKDNQITASDPALRSSAELLVKLVANTPSVNAQPGDVIKFEFPDRRFAMQLVQTRHLTAILGQKKYRVVPVPTLTNDQFLCPRRLYFAIRKGSDAEERSSWELIKWLVRKDVSMPRAPLGFPCRKDIVDRPEFKAWAQKGPEGLSEIFTYTAQQHDLGPFVLNRGAAISEWGTQLRPLLTGNTDYDRVLADAAGGANKLLVVLPDYRATGKKPLSMYE